MSRAHARAIAALEDHTRRRNLAPATCDRLSRTAWLLLRTVTASLRKIGSDDVRRFVAARSLTLAHSTQVAEVSRLRVMFGAWVEAGLVVRDPTVGLVVEPAPQPARLLLSEAAVGRLLDAALIEVASQGGRPAALRDRAAIELLYGLGLRAAEARAARVVDLDLAAGTLLVRRVKRGAHRVLPLPQAALPHLATYLAEGRPTFVRRANSDAGALIVGNTGMPVRPEAVSRLVQRVAAKAGIVAHAHAFRRAVSTHMVRRGVSVVAVAELLGHSRLDSVRAYVEVEREDLRKATALLDLSSARA